LGKIEYGVIFKAGQGNSKLKAGKFRLNGSNKAG
jgi:hypothetical protein